MIIHVDGQEIPVLTEADLTDEERAEFDKPVNASMEDGHLETRLPGSEAKATMYDVKGNLQIGSRQSPLDFTIVRPPGGDVPMSLSSLRPLRVEGREDHQADAAHQIKLFHAVGTVTVAGGHVEMAMRKVLVSLRGGENTDLGGDDIPAEWSRLHDELTKLCKNETSDRQRSVNALLAEAENAKWRESRNNVVHGYWWLVPMGNDLTMARYFHPKANQAPANANTTAEGLQKLARRLFTFAAKLEALVTTEWPLAIIPALGGYRGDSSQGISLRERLDDQTTKSEDLRVSKSTKPKPGQRPARDGSRNKRKRR